MLYYTDSDKHSHALAAIYLEVDFYKAAKVKTKVNLAILKKQFVLSLSNRDSQIPY